MGAVIVLEDGTTIVPYNSDRTGAQMDRAMDRGDSVGDISQLTTTNKSSIVVAMNEVNSAAVDVVQARVDDEGISHTTLKARIDSDNAQRKSDLTELSDTRALKQGNLFDKDAATTGTIVVDGVEEPSQWYSCSDYIYVRGGITYTISNTLSSAGCFFDLNLNYVSKIHNQAVENYEYTPSASGYIRVNFRTESLASEYIIEGTDYTSVAPYGKLYNDGLVINKNQVNGLAADLEKIDVTDDKVDYVIENLALKQGNLLDKSTITSGKIVKNDGTIADNASYGYSDYIPVSAGVHYIISQGLSAAGAIYNSNKEYVSRAYTVSSATSNFEFVASTTGYVRLNFNLSLLDSSFLALASSDISDLAPYGKLSNPDLVVKKSQILQDGIKLVIFGDSRTWYDGHEYGDKTKSEYQGNVCVGYQQTIAALTGAIITSQGVSGNTSAQICERIREYDFTGFDAVLLEGGVNDYVKSSSVTIGELQPIGSTFDTTTAYGAWQSAIEYLMINYPDLKIYIDTPAVCWLGENDTILPYDVAKIKKDVAELYSLPCKDMYKELGITTINRDTFYCDDVELTNNWHLHFNDVGNVKLGEVLAKFIMSN